MMIRVVRFLACCLVWVSLGAWTHGAPTIQTADPLASQATLNVLIYLQNVGRRTTHRVITGQDTGAPNCCSTAEYIQNAYPAMWTALCTAASACPGLAGFEYIQWNQQSPGTTVTYSAINTYIKSAWAAGSLVEITTSPNNPWNGQPWNNEYCGGPFSDLVNPSTAAYTAWHTTLDQFAAGLSDLQSAGVPVILRILGEQNGKGTWYSVCNTGWSGSDYSAAWIDAFNYLTTTKGLHNILWAYCSSSPSSQPSGLTLYPGRAYVDLVGLDIYYDSTGPNPEDFYDNWSAWQALGKPVSFFERGPHNTDGTSQVFTQLLPNIVANRGSSIPLVSYFMAWTLGYSLINNLGGVALLSDANAANQSDVAAVMACMATATTYAARVACALH